MGALITLDEYYNKIGKEIFPDWSEETIKYLIDKEHREKFKKFKERARKVHRECWHRLLKEGKIKISVRKEQGYIDVPFAIEHFNFPRSVCSDRSGEYYPCKVEIRIETRGRKKSYPKLKELISLHVEETYISKGISKSDIKAAAVIHHIRMILKDKPPSPSTISAYFLEIYPECAKTTRNSK